MNDIDLNIVGNPFVSVVVPVYNVERYLRQCINSIVHQTLKNIEIILVDDGSTDGCSAICDDYAEKDRRVKVIHQPNGGYGKACNAGFAKATGEYIGIIESDDYAELNMFEKLYGLAKAHNLDIVKAHFYHYRSQKNSHQKNDVWYVQKNAIIRPADNQQLFYQAQTVWSTIYQKTFISQNNIRFTETPGTSFRDISFTFKSCALAGRFMLAEDTLVHHRYDNEGFSVDSENVFRVCEEYAEIERFVDERGLAKKFLPIIARIKFTTYMGNYKRLDKKNGLAFLREFSREMRFHLAQKAVKRELFSRKERLKLYLIARSPFLFHFIIRAKKHL